MTTLLDSIFAWKMAGGPETGYRWRLLAEHPTPMAKYVVWVGDGAEEQLIAAYLARLPQQTRCRYPKCNKPFVPWRADQQFCNKTCSSRYYPMETYHREHGLEMPTPVATGDDAVVRDELLARLAALKTAADAQTAPVKLPGGTYQLPTASARDAAEREHRAAARDREQEARERYARFDAALRAAGHDPETQFWRDQLQELYQSYIEANDVLPATSVIDGFKIQQED